MPPIIFMGVGALTDFGPMLRNYVFPYLVLLQLGIFTVLLVAILMGFTPKEAASLGIIGGADGPTAILQPLSWLRICWDRLLLPLIRIWR